MRKLVLITVFCVAWVVAGCGGSIALKATATPSSAHATAVGYVWVVSASGTIHATSDGGAHWVTQHSGTRLDLNDVAFADRRHGWAVGGDPNGERGVIIATRDGGVHWVTQLAPTGLGVESVTCVDSHYAWAAAAGRKGWAVMATSDGGRTWTSKPVRPAPTVPTIVFVDRSHGWLEGRQYILATTDGGRHWHTQLRAVGQQEFHDVAFCDAVHGFVTGDDNGLAAGMFAAAWSTGDGGATWRELPGPSDQNTDPDRVVVTDASHITISSVLQDGLWSSSDAGRHWTQCTLIWPRGSSDAPVRLISDVAFSTPSQGWAIGSWVMQNNYDNGAILMTTDGGAHWRIEPASRGWPANAAAMASLR